MAQAEMMEQGELNGCLIQGFNLVTPLILRGGVIAIKTLHHADEKFVTVLPVINLALWR
jgi:hypothetical protein